MKPHHVHIYEKIDDYGVSPDTPTKQPTGLIQSPDIKKNDKRLR